MRDSLEKISQKSPDAKRLSEELSRHFMENKKPLDAEIYGIHVLDVEGTVIASTERVWSGLINRPNLTLLRVKKVFT
ncbi:MAG: hypothetical protein U0586_03690 [Candidatus Brocadiaceae bacterium]